MAILIKNPETERKARELASLRGQSITAVIDGALDRALADVQSKPRKLSLEGMIAATEALHVRAGIKGPLPPVSEGEWDDMNEIPGLLEKED